MVLSSVFVDASIGLALVKKTYEFNKVIGPGCPKLFRHIPAGGSSIKINTT